MASGQPARLIGFFAHEAPVCVIARRGPSRYTRLILWDIEQDLFTPGQWFIGKVNDLTMTRDGKYLAIGIMGSKRGDQLVVVCRPPYVTALEVWEGGLCMMGHGFLPNDNLVVPSTPSLHKVHAASKCPFKRIGDDVRKRIPGGSHSWVIDARSGPAVGRDHRGRKISFDAGRIFLQTEGEKTLLLDTNPMKFEPIEAPAWARDW